MATNKKLGRVALYPNGEWSASATYAALDVVSYGGGSWVAKKASTGVTPTSGDYWQQMASIGETGPQGEKGDKGDDGCFVLCKKSELTFDGMTELLSAGNVVSVTHSHRLYTFVESTVYEKKNAYVFSAALAGTAYTHSHSLILDSSDTWTALDATSASADEFDALGLTVVDGAINLTFEE